MARYDTRLAKGKIMPKKFKDCVRKVKWQNKLRKFYIVSK